MDFVLGISVIKQKLNDVLELHFVCRQDLNVGDTFNLGKIEFTIVEVNAYTGHTYFIATTPTELSTEVIKRAILKYHNTWVTKN